MVYKKSVYKLLIWWIWMYIQQYGSIYWYTYLCQYMCDDEWTSIFVYNVICMCGICVILFTCECFLWSCDLLPSFYFLPYLVLSLMPIELFVSCCPLCVYVVPYCSYCTLHNTSVPYTNGLLLFEGNRYSDKLKAYSGCFLLHEFLWYHFVIPRLLWHYST